MFAAIWKRLDRVFMKSPTYNASQSESQQTDGKEFQKGSLVRVRNEIEGRTVLRSERLLTQDVEDGDIGIVLKTCHVPHVCNLQLLVFIQRNQRKIWFSQNEVELLSSEKEAAPKMLLNSNRS